MVDDSSGIPLDAVAGHLATLRALDAKIKELTGARGAVRDLITAILGPAELGTIGGRPVVRYTHIVTRRLSTELVKRKFTPVDLDDCYVVAESRRFTLVDDPS